LGHLFAPSFTLGTNAEVQQKLYHTLQDINIRTPQLFITVVSLPVKGRVATS
jgi:hypothetical protein